MSAAEAPPLTAGLCLVDALSTMLADINRNVLRRGQVMVWVGRNGWCSLGLAVECGGDGRISVTVLDVSKQQMFGLGCLSFLKKGRWLKIYQSILKRMKRETADCWLCIR